MPGSNIFETASLALACLLAASLVGSGCTSHDGDPAARSDLALDPCNLTAPFGPAVPAFTAPGLFDGLTFSTDGLTAYLSARPNSTSAHDIFVATRTAVAHAFEIPGVVTSVSGTSEDRAPSLTSDGLRLYVARLNGNSLDLYVATRANTGQQFGTPTILPASFARTGFHDQDPFYFSLSGTNQLFFASEYPSGTRDLYVSDYSLGSGTYSTPIALNVSLPDVEDYRPILSPDGLTLYFASTRHGIGGDNEGDIFMATRDSLGAQFGSVTNLLNLNSSNQDFPVARSNDGCTLFFASNRDVSTGTQTYRLYEARRGPSTPALVSTTLSIVGSGSSVNAPFQCSDSCWAQGAPGTTTIIQLTGQAKWSGTCAGVNGTTSSDGVLVFTDGGVCTATLQPAPSPCSTNTAFGPISQVLPGLTADGLTLSADELTAYVSRKETTHYDIFVTTRPTKNAAFGPLTLVPNINTTAHERAPWLSENGLKLYFWVGYQPFGSDIWMASRPTPGAAFGAPTVVSSLNSGQGDEDPFFILGGSRAYFASDRPGGGRDLWTSVRIEGSYTTPTKMLDVSALNEWEEERRPILTADGLAIYFHSQRSGWDGDTDGDIWISQRSSLSSSFSSPVGILGVNTQAREFPVWLTRDECTLYFGSNRDDGGGTAQTFRLYRATRGAGCTPGVPPDDGNLCTIDTCDPIQGAIHTPVAAGTSCADGNVCDGNEVCNGFGACTSGTPPNLDDANPCTTDGCTQATGIVHAPVSAGTACGDGNVCNGPEQCNATGQCQAGTPLSTDDENPCTLDECDPVNGVSHTPRPAGSNCADEDPCDGEETCSSETECLGIAPEPLPAECQENPPVSTRCGDAIRDPVDEECDDGPGEQIDACAADCRVTDVPVAPLPRVEGERLSRTLGFGRHPLAAAAQATLVTYTELEDSASSLRGAFFQSRGQPSTLIDVGTGALPSEYADASAAAIGPNLFVAAWNDLGHGSLDIALRRLTAGDPPVLGDVVIANTTAGGAQRDPDLVWTGAELVVAWASEFVIIARRFDANLAPLGGEQQLGFSDEIAGSVALTRFGETWAAAWRTIDENSLELLRVHTGAAEWTIGPFLPGAELERPAIVELDSTHLLVVFTEGTDPLATGTPSVSRLRGAILDTTEPGAADWFDLESAVEPHASDGTIVQSRPALARAGTRLFLGWETESLIAGELSSEVWLRELGWNAVALTFATERPLQATLSREDAQHVPAFAATQLIPEGALALAFEEHAEAWPHGSRPDVVFSLRPVPFVTLE